MNVTKFIPLALRREKRWVLWKRSVDGNGKVRKTPVTVTGSSASTADAGTWTTYDKAREAVDAAGNGFGGIGIALPDGFVMIDLDGCIVNGELSTMAREIVNRFAGTFTEVSQSGYGLHIYCRGFIPRQVRQAGIEVYASPHFSFVTGDALQAVDVAFLQVAIDWLFEKYVENRGQAEQHTARIDTDGARIDVDVLIDRARRCRAADVFAQLFDDGNTTGYPSQSEADARLMGLLYWVSFGDEVATVEAFKRSRLAETLDRKHNPQQYLQRTLDAVRRSTAISEKHTEGAKKRPTGGAERVRECTITTWTCKQGQTENRKNVNPFRSK